MAARLCEGVPEYGRPWPRGTLNRSTHCADPVHYSDYLDAVGQADRS